MRRRGKAFSVMVGKAFYESKIIIPTSYLLPSITFIFFQFHFYIIHSHKNLTDRMQSSHQDEFSGF